MSTRPSSQSVSRVMSRYALFSMHEGAGALAKRGRVPLRMPRRCRFNVYVALCASPGIDAPAKLSVPLRGTPDKRSRLSSSARSPLGSWPTIRELIRNESTRFDSLTNLLRRVVVMLSSCAGTMLSNFEGMGCMGGRGGMAWGAPSWAVKEPLRDALPRPDARGRVHFDPISPAEAGDQRGVEDQVGLKLRQGFCRRRVVIRLVLRGRAGRPLVHSAPPPLKAAEPRGANADARKDAAKVSPRTEPCPCSDAIITYLSLCDVRSK